MFGILRGWLASDMAIDLGTANTIIYVDKKGIVLNEPSVVAIEQQGQKKTMRDIGHGAKEMLGRTPGNIVAMRPLKDGVIADFEVTEQMLNAFIKRAHGAKWFTPGPRIIVCVPCSATQVERRAIRESTLNAGATKVYLIEEPMAAAIGCDLPVNEPSGSMVVDIGGGTTEIGIVSLGGLVHGEAIHAGGDKIDEAIIAYVRQQHGIAIGEGTAEEVKKRIAVAHPDQDIREITVSGRHVGEGVPRAFKINSGEVLDAINEPMRQIVQAVRHGLEKTPPELSGDIAARGIMLTGGGALIRNIDVRLQKETGLPVRIAEDPLTCVARGCGAALRFIDNIGGGVFS